MESISWARTQRRLTIVDRLATDEPGSLSSCSFSDLGDGIYEINNNDQQMLSYYLSDYVQQYWPYMYDETNNNDEQRRPLHISSLLNSTEKDSIRQYVGKNSALLACGVCQLLEERDGLWNFHGVGVICLIRDYDQRIFSLSLVDPTSDGSPARTIWRDTLNRDFITTKGHSNLISFEIPAGLFGLNFCDNSEADFFHNTVIRTRQDYLNKKSMRKTPKRKAPPPPITLNAAGETTSHGIEIPIMVTKEKKKTGFLGKFFGQKGEKKEKKNKKNKGRPTISNPSNFQHLQTGFEGMSEEQKELVKALIRKGLLNMDMNDEEHVKVINERLNEPSTYEKLAAVVKEKNEEQQENAHPVFNRTTSNGLSEARSSIKILKAGRGNTPRDIKKQSHVKKQENFDPLRANWEIQYVPPQEYSPPLPTGSPPVEDAPPIPNRTESRRPNLNRQNTPPYSRNGPLPGEAFPRLPSRVESRLPPPVSSLPISQPPRPPSPPVAVNLPPVSSSAPPAPPPPPPSIVIPTVKPPVAAPPPPPSLIGINVNPPPSLTNSNLPTITDGRRNFLDEIQSVDKSKLLRPAADRSPSRVDVTPTSQGLGIIDSIQRELDIRRTMINSSSDDDSSDEDDSDSWSD